MPTSRSSGDEARAPGRWARTHLTLLGLLSVAYAPMFWGQVIFFRDPAHWNFPARAFVRKALLSGEFPHWNPFTGLGLPVWGNPLYGLFYPPNWLLLMVSEPWLANALTWQSFAHTVWGGWGVLRLARQFRCGRAACLVAALTWSLGGYTTSMWSAGLLLLAGAWVPWVAVGLISAVIALQKARPAEAVLKAGVPLAFAWLSGEPFIAMMAMGFGVLTTWAWVHNERQESAHPADPAEDAAHSRPFALRTVLWLSLGWTCALLVASIVVLPARAVLSQSPRAQGVGASEAERYSLHPIRLLEFVAPESLGLPVVDYPGGKYAGEASIDGLPLAFSVYFGACAVALALVAFGSGRRSAAIVGGLFFCVLLLTFGRYTPVHSLWRSVAFPFKFMRYPEKYVVLLVGWASLLSGLGVERLIQGARVWKRVVVLLLGVLVALALVGSIVDPQLARYMRGGLVRGAIPLLLLLALLWFRGRRPMLFAPLLCAVVFIDLCPTVWNLQPFGPPKMTSEAPPLARTILSQVKSGHLPRLYRSHKVADTVAPLVAAASLPESESRWLQTLTPNFGSAFGIAAVPGYDAATSNHFDGLWSEGLSFGATTLRLLSIDFALLPVRNPAAPDARAGEHYEPIMDPLPGARLYKVLHTLPRVYAAAAAPVLDDKQTLFRLFTPEVTDGLVALVAARQDFQGLAATPAKAGTCWLKAGGLSRVDAECDMQQQGVAVFVDQFDPAWRVRVDGAPQPLLRVNHALRGVHLQPGRHRIEMHYVPQGVTAAAVLSALGLAGFVVAAVARWRRKSRKLTA